MILAVDVYYDKTTAKVVGVMFNPGDEKASGLVTAHIDRVAAYEPGHFYKRELPCILALLEEVNMDDIDTIIIDGYVYASNTKVYGLGGHLFENIVRSKPVIGVAKTPFANNEETRLEVLRGESKTPLFVSAIGMELNAAAELVKNLHGEFRIPTMLKELDRLTRE